MKMTSRVELLALKFQNHCFCYRFFLSTFSYAFFPMSESATFFARHSDIGDSLASEGAIYFSPPKRTFWKVGRTESAHFRVRIRSTFQHFVAQIEYLLT